MNSILEAVLAWKLADAETEGKCWHSCEDPCGPRCDAERLLRMVAIDGESPEAMEVRHHEVNRKLRDEAWARLTGVEIKTNPFLPPDAIYCHPDVLEGKIRPAFACKPFWPQVEPDTIENFVESIEAAREKLIKGLAIPPELLKERKD